MEAAMSPSDCTAQLLTYTRHQLPVCLNACTQMGPACFGTIVRAGNLLCASLLISLLVLVSKIIKSYCLLHIVFDSHAVNLHAACHAIAMAPLYWNSTCITSSIIMCG